MTEPTTPEDAARQARTARRAVNLAHALFAPGNHDDRCPLAKPWLYDPEEGIECICADLRAEDELDQRTDRIHGGHRRGPRHYRKKPVVVEAIRWDGTPEGATPIIDWILENGGTATYHCTHLIRPDALCPGSADPADHVLAIVTLEGTMAAYSGDWIVRGTQDDGD